MMWHPISPTPVSTNSEPFELRLLKEQLAHVSCNCRSCNYTSDSFYDKLKDTKEVEVQAERYISVDTKSNYTENNIKNALCPTCCMTLNILRGGVVRVLKDEESETQTSMFSSDKSTSNRIKSREKTTSVETKLISKQSNLALCENISDASNEVPVRTIGRSSSPNPRKRAHQDRVSFLDSPYQVTDEFLAKQLGDTKCLCLEDFINSIRPPLTPYS